MSDRFGEALPGATYKGFSGPPAMGSGEARAPAEPMSRKLLYGGIALAVGIGLAVGLWARPELASAPQDREPMRAAVQIPTEVAAADAQIVPVEVLAPIPPPAPTADGPLEVLPADLARRAEAARPIAQPRPVPVKTPARSAADAGSQVVAIAPAPPPVLAPRAPALDPAPRPARSLDPAPRQAQNEGPAFNCRFARSPSERLVCGDAELATLDRRLNRAFDRAVSSGIPFRELRAEQDDWLNIREDAALHSPEAVESVYRQRIRELNAIAEDN